MVRPREATAVGWGVALVAAGWPGPVHGSPLGRVVICRTTPWPSTISRRLSSRGRTTSVLHHHHLWWRRGVAAATTAPPPSGASPTCGGESAALDTEPEPVVLAPLDLEEELRRFREDLAAAPPTAGKEGGGEAALSSPTRLAGAVVAAANAGREDIVASVASAVLASECAQVGHNRGILAVLLAQASRFRLVDTIVPLLERAIAIDAQNPQAGKTDEAAEDADVLRELQLDRQYARFSAFNALLFESVRQKNVERVVHTINLLCHGAVRYSAPMQATVTDLLKETGVNPFLAAMKQYQKQRHSTPSILSRELHPGAMGFFLRCINVLLDKKEMEENTSILRFASYVDAYLESNHSYDNTECYRQLIELYRLLHGTMTVSGGAFPVALKSVVICSCTVKPVLVKLLSSFDAYRVKITPFLLEKGVPGLRLWQINK